ncbi:MAG: hypothetical protein RJA98_3175 [Pseudomonadota bacterium]|jgi:hypothetical protein
MLSGRLFVRKSWLAAALLLAVLLLAGCDMLGIESPEKAAASKEAEGKAIGGACRHGGRAIEDCYTLNKKADKSAVFAGWKEMNDYMRENNIEPVPPQIPVAPPSAPKAASSADGEADAAEPAPAKSKSKAGH